MKRLLCFDLDDTLWPVKPVLIAAEQKVQDFFRERCPEFLSTYSLEDMVRKRDALWASRPELAHQISKLRQETTRELILDMGKDEATADALSAQAFDVFIEARHKVSYYDSVSSVLETLHRQYILGALSNGNADVFKLDIGKYFDFRINAEHINSSKPGPLHFEMALERSGLDPREVVHIGDHPEHDVSAAQQMGMQTVWVNYHKAQWQDVAEQDIPAADAEIQHFSELPQVLSSLLASG